ncbi:hypothetical protein [Nitrosovibrio tenuis]|uniref:hypothetical protein n=1 Tax=Nitrosovibrio tenuis TaxID=1233 RepID=UPI00115F9735|nr:hypothetical protein [Nitrosovibrio tenuis]
MSKESDRLIAAEEVLAEMARRLSTANCDVTNRRKRAIVLTYTRDSVWVLGEHGVQKTASRMRLIALNNSKASVVFPDSNFADYYEAHHEKYFVFNENIAIDPTGRHDVRNSRHGTCAKQCRWRSGR